MSILIETQGRNILIDTAPDLRQQALHNNVTRIDAVLYTHDHADHMNGIDDLRSFNYLSDAPLPIYADDKTLGSIQQRFAYVFLPRPEKAWYRPCLIPNILPITPIQTFDVLGITVTAFLQHHGKGWTLGYRIGDFAYSTDADILPESAFQALKGTSLWVVDCLRYAKSPSHASLAESLEWINRVKPQQAILTHMSHDFEYEKLSTELPPGVVPAHDGMVLQMGN